MKSGAPINGRLAILLTVSCEYVSPVGFECLGMHHIPLMLSSFLTKSSTIFMSGPSPVNGTFIILIPSFSQSAKCRSYPGTGQIMDTVSNSFQGASPLPLKRKDDKRLPIKVKLLFEEARTNSSE